VDDRQMFDDLTVDGEPVDEDYDEIYIPGWFI